MRPKRNRADSIRPDLLTGLLKNLDMALLERVAPRQYNLCAPPPDFYNAVFETGADGAPTNAPWNSSPMLEHFLNEAESFFSEGAPGGVRYSGYWLENGSDGEDVPLMASARAFDGNEVIIISAAGVEYAERARILRQARNELLERQKAATDLNKYKEKALYDSLTKVFTRGAFNDILKDKLQTQRPFTDRRHSQELSALMLDIDHFKIINDEFGHQAGDAVLVQLGEILKGSLRSNDAPARYGGEEFIIIAPGTGLKQSQALAEKLRRKVSEHDFGLGRPVTISIGCAVYVPGEEPSAFIGRADQALYDAKKAGRNLVRIR